MLYYLTDIFGTAITVGQQPAVADQQLAGLPGANGLIGMNLGTRGRPIVITGRLYAWGVTYTIARGILQMMLANIETWLYPGQPEADFSYFDWVYANVIFQRMNIIADPKTGKQIHYSNGYCWVDFICNGIQLA